MFLGKEKCRECCITEYKQGLLYNGHSVNSLNTDLNPICHLLALLGVHNIFHVCRIRVKQSRFTARCSEDVYRLLSSITTDELFLNSILVNYFQYKQMWH